MGALLNSSNQSKKKLPKCRADQNHPSLKAEPTEDAPLPFYDAEALSKLISDNLFTSETANIIAEFVCAFDPSLLEFKEEESTSGPWNMYEFETTIRTMLSYDGHKIWNLTSTWTDDGALSFGQSHEAALSNSKKILSLRIGSRQRLDFEKKFSVQHLITEGIDYPEMKQLIRTHFR